MIIGPEPMTRTFLMSARLGIGGPASTELESWKVEESESQPHDRALALIAPTLQLSNFSTTVVRSLPDKTKKSIVEELGIRWPWTPLGVKLYGEGRKITMPDPLHGPIVEVQVRDLKGSGEVRVHREPMVLRGDHHPAWPEPRRKPRRHFDHRLVGPAMTELHPIGTAPTGQRQELMPQAHHPHHRICLHEGLNSPDHISEDGRIPWAVGQQHAIRGKDPYLLRRRRVGYQDDFAPSAPERLNDPRLHAAVEDHDARSLARQHEWRGAGDLTDQILLRQRRDRRCPRLRLCT